MTEEKLSKEDSHTILKAVTLLLGKEPEVGDNFTVKIIRENGPETDSRERKFKVVGDKSTTLEALFG